MIALYTQERAKSEKARKQLENALHAIISLQASDFTSRDSLKRVRNAENNIRNAINILK